MGKVRRRQERLYEILVHTDMLEKGERTGVAEECHIIISGEVSATAGGCCFSNVSTTPTEPARYISRSGILASSGKAVSVESVSSKRMVL